MPGACIAIPVSSKRETRWEGKLEYRGPAYYEGQFQDGIKEGKGEEHHLLSSKQDSVLSGYWSADEYRGRQYVTYSFSTTEQFDQTSCPSPGTVIR